MMNKFIVIFVSVVVLNSPCFAAGGDFPVIRWECLGLSYNQQAQMKELDSKWQRINQNLRTNIINDQKALQYILSNPYSTQKEIRELHNRILSNRTTLREQAMEIFLEKRDVLTQGQKKNLHLIISR